MMIKCASSDTELGCERVINMVTLLVSQQKKTCLLGILMDYGMWNLQSLTNQNIKSIKLLTGSTLTVCEDSK